MLTAGIWSNWPRQFRMLRLLALLRLEMQVLIVRKVFGVGERAQRFGHFFNNCVVREMIRCIVGSHHLAVHLVYQARVGIWAIRTRECQNGSARRATQILVNDSLQTYSCHGQSFVDRSMGRLRPRAFGSMLLE